MYISGLVLFIVLEAMAVAIIVAVLLVRLKYKQLRNAHPVKDTPETALQSLIDQCSSKSPIDQLRKQLYLQDLGVYQGKVNNDDFINQFNAPDSEVSAAAKAKIGELEEKLQIQEGKLADALQALQKMSRKEAEQIKPSPMSGEKTDEIYRLKCDKFDLQEKINALSMQLDQLIPDKKDQLTTLLLEQVEVLKESAKQSDEVISLLEAKLEALVGNSTDSPNDGELLSADSLPVEAPDDWATFRSKMQKSLDALSAKIVELQAANEKSASNPDDHDADEARKLLSLFVQDSQEMMHCITELESENAMLKQQITELQVMVDSGGNVEAAAKIKALKTEIAQLKALTDDTESL